jgi:AraC-like DNA-binding protein
VVNPSVRLAIHEDKDHVNVDLDQAIPWADTHAFMVDTLITACHELVSLFDTEIADEVAYFVDYPCPPDMDVYSARVSGKLLFDRPSPRISIPGTFCRRLLPMYNPAAVIEAEKALQNFLDRINQRRLPLLFEIKELVASHLAEPPAFDTVAAHVHLSPRTLNRRLKALDTSYKEIISDTRKHRAFEYLAGNSLTINQIANRLGYSDPSNFSKAFKHWTGLSPSDFRDASLSMAYSNDSIDDRR